MSSTCSCINCTDGPIDMEGPIDDRSSTMDPMDDSIDHNNPSIDESSSTIGQDRLQCDGQCEQECIDCQGSKSSKCANKNCIMCVDIVSQNKAQLSQNSAEKNNKSDKVNGGPPPLTKRTVAPFQEYNFGMEKPMPISFEIDRVSDEEGCGKERRRKKSASRRMEQIIRQTNGKDQPPPPPVENVEVRVRNEGMETLDRAKPRSRSSEVKSERRMHKRSILKQREDKGDVYLDMGKVARDGIKNNHKVKFAQSLKKRQQAAHFIHHHGRIAMLHPPCQVHLPFPSEYIDMRHILASVDPRYPHRM